MNVYIKDAFAKIHEGKGLMKQVVLRYYILLV